ncbi:MAG TPA: SDR family oxidoreductase [Candidatus Competibacteraceae bacterium]|nr:MAG: SDR family oxidoreductase [Candidatus Competibacteraceae bacterium]HQC71252.1 SDR family oxidoreductase [Candidatus Competibacteraceae bacterium]
MQQHVDGQERTILISGCSSGIGRCAAEGLRARGWRVFATARQPADVAQLQAAGLESLLLDLSDSASIRTAVATVLERSGGRLDALFNNAAYGQPGAVEDLSRAALREQFEVNLFGTQELSNQVIPVLRRQGHGRIVYNSSVLGLVAFAYRGAYVASKFALEGLADTLRQELRGTGIHVCLIEPGPILSRFRDNAHVAYQRHIDPAHSVHREQYAAMEARLLKEGPAAPFTLPPEAVLKRLIHAVESPRPQARYFVTAPTYLFALLRRLLPTSALDALLHRASGGGRR